MELRRERVVAELLDPRNGFERARVPLEVRWDPLTGQSSRLLPEGSVPPPAAHDLASLDEQTRETCPFCSPRLESATPRFPPELWPEGRIRHGEAVLFPNLVAYAKWSSVSVYSPRRHVIRLEELTPALLADNLAAQATFARAVAAHDPASRWTSVNANHLPPSGSSVLHPHLQGTAGAAPTTVQRLLAEVAPAAVREYVASERANGERFVAAGNGVDWLASFAPLGPGEVRAYVWDAASPAELEAGSVEQLARGISAVLAVYAALGFESFNLALYGAGPGHALSLRVVARAYFGPLLRADAMWSERLHWEAATDLAPERVAELARAAFSAPGG